MGKTDLIYIYGNGRSGTTLLTSLLNYQNNYIGVGELNKGFRDMDRFCTCGASILQCPYWKKVISQTEDETGIDKKEFFKIFSQIEKKKPFMLWLVGFKKKQFEKYKLLNASLIKALHNCSGNRIPVDSSKNFMRLFILRKFDNNLKIIHSVRNPKAVLYSNMNVFSRNKFRERKDIFSIRFIYLIYVLVSWNITNGIGWLIKKTNLDNILLIKYEKLVTDPDNTIAAINRELKTNNSKINKQPEYHIIYGNRMIREFTKDNIKIDEEWKGKLKWYHYLAIHFFTFPTIWLFKYGKT